MPTLCTNSNHIMGKDKTKDGDATTSTETREHSQDWEAARDATLARTIA